MRAAAALALLVLGCGGQTVAPVAAGEAFEGSLSPPPRPNDAVVAEVNGDAIYAGDVELQMKATGQSAKDAVDTLIDAQLLAQEARRRGLTEDPEVVAVRHRERARRLIEAVFEPSFATPDAVPQDEVEKVYAMPEVHQHFVHPEFRVITFVRAEAGKAASPETWEKARIASEKFYAAATAGPSPAPTEIAAFAEKVGADAGFPLKTMSFTTGREGYSVEEFAAAAFSIESVGGFARPVRTNWGWDVLHLDGIQPPQNVSLAEAAPEIRQGRFEASRHMAFLRWVDGFVAQAHVTRHDELLGAIDVDSPLTLAAPSPGGAPPGP
jgi:peptidyl-prolyl cis-trans isomerase C